MHIIWITTQFPQGKENVDGIFIYRTVKALSQHYKISVVCLYPTLPPILTMLKNPSNWKLLLSRWKKLYPSDPISPEGLNNVEVIYLKYPRLWRGKLLFCEGNFAFFSGKKIFEKLIKQDSILHANWIFPEGKLAMIISKKYNLPFVVTLRGGEVDVDNFLQFGTKNWSEAKYILDSANKITSVSTVLLERFKLNKLISENKETFLTHNIYEFDKFFIKDRQDARKILGLPENEKIILFVGSLTRRKNIFSLIKAFSIINKSETHIRLIIIGAGVEENFLKRLVSKEELNNVYFLGKILPEKLTDFFNAADLFCLTSTSEGLPNVIIESMLCGTPVIGSSIDEIPHVIKDKINGFLINPNSVNEIADKIKTALTTRWDRYAIRTSVDFLSPEKILAEYKYIYENLNN